MVDDTSRNQRRYTKISELRERRLADVYKITRDSLNDRRCSQLEAAAYLAEHPAHTARKIYSGILIKTPGDFILTRERRL